MCVRVCVSLILCACVRVSASVRVCESETALGAGALGADDTRNRSCQRNRSTQCLPTYRRGGGDKTMGLTLCDALNLGQRLLAGAVFFFFFFFSLSLACAFLSSVCLRRLALRWCFGAEKLKL